MLRKITWTIRGLMVTVVAISTVVTLILAVTVTLLMHKELERQLDERIEMETHALRDYYRDKGFDALVQLIASKDQTSETGEVGYLAGVDETRRSMIYLVVDAAGQRRAGSHLKRIPPRGWSEFVRFRRPDGSKSMAQAMNSDLAGGGQLIVGADRAVIRQLHRTMLKLFAAALGLLLLLSVAATIIFGRVIQRRLNAIEASAVGIMAGDLSRRMPLDGSGGEFDRLSLILNRMLDRVQDLLDNLRQVSGDIAHDLRTPLQRVRNRLEGTAKSAAGTPYQEPLEAAMQETDDLLELFASLLAISEVEGQSVRAGFVPLQLDEVVGEIVDVYQPTFEDAGHTLTLFPAPVSVRGDGRLLQRVIANLLDNALLHTPLGTHVQISVAVERDHAIILVSDDGPGIPPSEHHRMFRRLTRLDASRSTPGHGLGLSMVQAIVVAHDGTVEILPSPSGLTIRIVLPAVAS